jgi:hypothetical protein
MPISWWQFNDLSGASSLLDSQGTENAAVNNISLGQSQKPSGLPYSLSSGLFNGSTSYALTAQDPKYQVTKVSLAAWVYPTSLSNAPTVIEQQGGSPSEHYVMWLGANGRIFQEAVYYFFNLLSQTVQIGETTLYTSVGVPLNQWSFIVVTFDGLSMCIYLNTVLQATKSLLSTNITFPPGYSYFPLYTSPSSIILGGTFVTGPFTNAFKGYLCHARVYPRALTPIEVALLYRYNNV